MPRKKDLDQKQIKEMLEDKAAKMPINDICQKYGVTASAIYYHEARQAEGSSKELAALPRLSSGKTRSLNDIEEENKHLRALVKKLL